MPKNIYEDHLELFTFGEMLDSLIGIGAETGRLELKREMIANGKVAHIACSMANANGGIIAIGIAEPGGAASLKVHSKIDTSDGIKVGLVAAISARVYPPVPLDIHGYENGDRSFLVLRVGRSVTAPHEYIGSDNAHNLPIRRGSTTDHLRLAEIDALRARQTGEPSVSPLGQRQFPQVSLTHEGSNSSCIFGMTIQPVFYQALRRVMDTDDDRLCETIAEVTKGVNGRIHKDFELDRLVDGVWLHTPKIERDTANVGQFLQPNQQIQIDSDGCITVRYIQEPGNLWKQLFGMFATGYIAAQEIFYAFGIAPRALAYVVTRLNADARDAVPSLTQAYNDTFAVDLATQPFSDAFLATTMLALRAANQNSQREFVRNEMLQNFVDERLPTVDSLQRRWLSQVP